MKKLLINCLCFWVCIISIAYGDNKNPEPIIKIGFIAELSGGMHDIGQASKKAAFLAVKEINNAGGIQVGTTHYKLELIIADSNSSPAQAAQVAQKLIVKDQVAALVGPNSSSNALAVSVIAEQYQTVMITPWATDVNVSLDQKTGKSKQYVFRACFTDAEEANNAGKFARQTLNAKTAAVLFDNDFPVFKEQAEFFQKTFTQLGGKIVAFKSYSATTKDYNTLLAQIKIAAPEVIFMPSYYSSVAPILSLAHQIGIKAPFIGSDGWGNEDLLKLCGQICVGSYVINHYSPTIDNDLTKKFVHSYQAQYGSTPNDVAALTYDAFQLLTQTLKNTTNPTNRQEIRNSLAEIRTFNGVTGTMKFDGESGDPIKAGAIIQIKGSPLSSLIQPR